jgi:hypothetical protein
VGIGTASPGYPLHVSATDSQIVIQDSDTPVGSNPASLLSFWGSASRAGYIGYPGDNNLYINQVANASILFLTNNTEQMRLNSTGLGVGASPATRLHISNSGDVYARIATTSVSKAGVQLSANGVVRSHLLYDDGAGTTYLSSGTGFGGSGQALVLQSGTSLVFYTNNQLATANMTLDASGNLLVGKSSASVPTVGFQSLSNGETSSTMASSTSAATTLNVYSTGATAYRFYVGLNGTISATNTTISAISDARLKENVQDIDVGLGAILALKPRKFDWKAGKGKDIKGDRGFIAQEFEQVFPNLVDEWKDAAPEGEAPYKSVRQDLIPVLVKAIQELTARVEALEA